MKTKYIVTTLLMILLCCGIAQAEPLDFSKILIDEKGEQLVEDGELITFEKVCIKSLLITERGLSDKDKYIRYDLYKKIQSGDYDLTLEEKTLLKKLVGKYMPVLVAGQVRDWLEDK